MLRRRSIPEREAGRLLTAIYRDHSASSYRYAYHLTRSREDADDLVQIAFLGLYRTLCSGEAVMSPAAWLATTIKRRAINVARQRREQPASDQLDALAVSGNGEGSSASEAAEELARIQVLLHTLPETQHQAFVLRHWSGLSNNDIASVLDTTESAVESLLVRARAALLAAGWGEHECVEVCERLAADQPLSAAHEAHLSGCKRCGTASQRLATAAGIAVLAAITPSLRVAHALAATIPGFTVSAATGASSGGLAAAAGTKAGAAGVLAKTGGVVIAVTAAAVVGVHTHSHLLNLVPRPQALGMRASTGTADTDDAVARPATPQPTDTQSGPSTGRGPVDGKPSSGRHGSRTTSTDTGDVRRGTSAGTSSDGGGSSSGDSGSGTDGGTNTDSGGGSDNAGSSADGGSSDGGGATTTDTGGSNSGDSTGGSTDGGASSGGSTDTTNSD